MRQLLVTVSVLTFLLTAATGASAVDEKAWQKVHGKVEKVDGMTLTIKTDDNKTVTTDISQVSDSVRKGLTSGEAVTVSGQWKGDESHLVARFVQQDSSDPARGGSVAGQAAKPPVDEKSWQNVHGKVEKVEGTTLTFRTDGGKAVTADMAQVSENVRKALTPGEGVTVEGQYKADQNHMVARFIQQDSSNPARGGRVATPSASPKTTK
jgi:outer membrane lipoprotein SlyB